MSLYTVASGADYDTYIDEICIEPLMAFYSGYVLRLMLLFRSNSWTNEIPEIRLVCRIPDTAKLTELLIPTRRIYQLSCLYRLQLRQSSRNSEVSPKNLRIKDAATDLNPSNTFDRPPQISRLEVRINSYLSFEFCSVSLQPSK